MKTPLLLLCLLLLFSCKGKSPKSGTTTGTGYALTTEQQTRLASAFAYADSVSIATRSSDGFYAEFAREKDKEIRYIPVYRCDINKFYNDPTPEGLLASLSKDNLEWYVTKNEQGNVNTIRIGQGKGRWLPKGIADDETKTKYYVIDHRFPATVSTWTNCPTENANSLTVLATAGVIQILREYGYSSSAKEFTRRYYNGTWTTWVQTPRMSDVYTRTDADSRYVNVSGDTMTGALTLNSDLNLSANSHIIFNRENFNYLSVPLNGTFAFVVGTTLNGANTVLGIEGGKVFPGYHNGTISLGSSSYRWSNVYSVAGNFSGAVTISSTLTLGAGITGVSTITGKGFLLGTNALQIYDNTSKANRITLNWNNGIARLYAISDDGNTLKDIILGSTGSPGLYFDVSAGRWGIGTIAPAYTLDVRGEIRATSGITLSSTDDYGWYITNSRIVAGQSTARGVNVGSLLVSSAWADYTKVPTNGIYCKGNMQVARIGVGSSPNSNYAICTNGDAYLYNTIHTGDIHAQGDIDCNSLSATRLYIPSADGNNKYYIRIE